MSAIQIYDPALCCNTGVCGVDVDQRLVAFAADVDWLKGQGVTVERFNLAQQPQTFANHGAIRQLLQTQGEAALPAIVVEGTVKQSGGYPSRDQLAQWAGIAAAPSIFTEQVAALAAIAVTPASSAQSPAGCCGPGAAKADSTGSASTPPKCC